MKNPILHWALRLIPAIILLQTLFFKFSANEESVYIFSTLGIEPWGRIFSGVVELIAAILIIIPSTTALGALTAAGVMSGALLAHLFVLGIDVKGDGGLLFVLALVTLICSAVLIWLNKSQLVKLPLIGGWFDRK